jgi:hypothetical protein
MLLLLKFLHSLLRLFIFAKLTYLLWITHYYPTSYNFNQLTWWIYFIVFDIWLIINISNKNTNKFIDSDED